MKDLKEFVDTLVKIEYLDHCSAFGFYPFQMFVEAADEKLTICALDLGGDLRAVYKAFSDFHKDKAKRIYLAVDFPANMDIENDSIIAAGAVVTQNTIVESGCIYAGVPAKKVKDIDQSDFAGEIERISNNYVMYSGWFKED